MSRLGKILLPIAVLAAGVGAFVVLSGLQPARPPATVLERSAPEVEVATLAPREVALDVVANGTVQARDSVTIGPEVAGRVAFVSSSLRLGTFVAAGEVLVRLDAREPGINLRAAEADLNQAQAELARLEGTKIHLARDLELRRERVELAHADYERQRVLERNSVVSQGSSDQARSAWLAERSAHRAADQALDLLPHDLKRAQAALARAEAARDRARLWVERLVLRAPIDGQIRLSQVELGQVVAAVTVLARLDGHGVYEVVVQISHEDLSKLALIPSSALPLDLVAPAGFAGSPAAIVTWLAHPETPWAGRLTRIETVDSKTRTLPVIVEVERPWDRLAQGQTPLLPGAYCRVRLAGKSVPKAWVVPEHALREGDQLYVLRGGRLAIVEVRVDHLLPTEIVVSPRSPLQAGDQLVLSRITYPVAGMRLLTRKPATKNNAAQ